MSKLTWKPVATLDDPLAMHTFRPVDEQGWLLKVEDLPTTTKDDQKPLEALRAYNAALDDLLAHLTLIIDNLRVDIPEDKKEAPISGAMSLDEFFRECPASPASKLVDPPEL